MPLPDLDRVLFNADEKVFVLNPQKNQPALRNVATTAPASPPVLM